MQRRLIVMRHAKSSWNSDARSDHERPLNQRGERDAPKVAAALVEAGWVPDLILSSDSQRTRETVAGMHKSFPAEVETRYLSSFYHGGEQAAREEVPGVGEEVECLMVLGHNPGWEDLASWLAGKSIVMKTATAVLLSRELSSWEAAMDKAGSWTLERVIYPRDL